MTLVPLWFIIITILWTGFFILEGFDFGVGMLHTFVGRGDADRRAVINTIRPLWDANEIWLIVAVAAMFAAFPGWYATVFSGFYLLVAVLLVALIVRGVSFEYRGKRDAPRWRRTWDISLTAGSVLAPFVIGVMLGDLLHGLPINSHQEYTGSFWTLLQPNLTVHNTASGAYSLRVLTVVAVIFPPLVLGYQAWTYYVFRRRVSAREFLPPSPRGAPDGRP